MSPVIDYDRIADRYERRYRQHSYVGVQAALLKFVGAERPDVIDVGCGSGHWLGVLAARTMRLAGIDPSRQMLLRAREAAPGALLVRGRATKLPFRDATFDRIVCVNALHHFGDRMQFFIEARRVLRSGGGLITIGRDPHAERDRWYVYDYFDGTRDFDVGRLAPVRTIRGELARAGFAWAESSEADRIERHTLVADALEAGILDRMCSSALMNLSDDAYERGLDRIRRADAERAAAGGLTLVTDQRLYATVGWV